MIHVISLEWAREVWVALAVIHHTLDMSGKLNAKEMLDLFNYESTNMKKHLTKFQQNCGQVTCSPMIRIRK
jgi:hypothetical protein